MPLIDRLGGDGVARRLGREGSMGGQEEDRDSTHTDFPEHTYICTHPDQTGNMAPVAGAEAGGAHATMRRPAAILLLALALLCCVAKAEDPFISVYMRGSADRVRARALVAGFVAGVIG